MDEYMPNRWRLALFGALCLSCALLFQAQSARKLSITYDETNYLDLGHQIFRQGTFEGCVDWGVAPLPLVLSYWLPVAVNDQERPGYGPRPGDPAQVELARTAHAVLVGVPLLLLVYGWLYRRAGLTAALAGGAFLAFSPNMLAHISLATTDACFTLFSLLTLAALCWYGANPSRFRLLGVGVALGLALASKYSAVFLLPLVAAVLARQVFAPGEVSQRIGRKLALLTARMAVLLAVAFVTLWGAFGFQFVPATTASADDARGARLLSALGGGPFAHAILDLGRTNCLPAPIKGFLTQSSMVAEGREVYLLGQVSPHGWRHYYLVALALKSTLAELMLLALALAAFFRRSKASGDSARLLWGAAAGLLLLLMSFSSKQLGLRYVLPVYPLLILLAIDLLTPAFRNGLRGAVACLAVLVMLQVGSAVRSQPDYLAYFNRFAGGAELGHRYLLDSNVDWGQDLPYLREHLEKSGGERVVMAYFGTCLPQEYGIDAIDWRRWREDGPNQPTCLAISVQYLQANVVSDGPFASFRGLRPSARAGYSIFVFDLKEPEVRRALTAARELYLAGEARRTGLGAVAR